MLRIHDVVYLPTTERWGFEPALSPEERAIQDQVHAFAAEVMRPIGRRLDTMSADEAIAPASRTGRSCRRPPRCSTTTRSPRWGPSSRCACGA